MTPVFGVKDMPLIDSGTLRHGSMPMTPEFGVKEMPLLDSGTVWLGSIWCEGQTIALKYREARCRQ
jgi:hypothetical protein